MNKHTSGKWVASPEENNNEWGIYSGKLGIAICAGAPGDGTAEANALLISAAPEMLKTMQALIDVIEMVDGRDDSLVIETVETYLRAAIAKATGESK